MFIDKRVLASFDWTLFFLIILIPCCGLFVLYSAGYDPDRTYFNVSWLGGGVHSLAFLKQSVFLSLGLVIMLIGMSIPTAFLYRIAYVMYIFCILLLLAVLMVGVVSNGSRRWLDVGFFNLQPSEFVKLAVILATARYLSKNPPADGGYTLVELIPLGLLIGIPMLLILRQPDLGTALSVTAVGISIILFVGVRLKTIAALSGVLLVGAVPAWNLLHDYQKRRVLTLFNPEADPLGSGYHVIQSKIAVGSGSVFGKGFLKGTQSQLEFLPEHTTDFVFSVLAEEWGFVGCVFVLALYCLLFVKILRVVQKSKEVFSTFVAFGIGSQILFHTLVNVGMVIGVLPVVGIPLPLFSYGGSSVLSVLFSLGIVLGVSLRRWAHLRPL
jgi:rod shape determining protein RodA